ncbi:MAG: 2-hydroxyacyl-CoA dehydratase [Deltaproteobacteria bacterium]|nr:2-hydroxyacyl-CoA dehydratase [Deltaproteobacteria bacterium]
MVGLTSTIPVEVVLAAGLRPLDLNNLFITSGSCEKRLRQAEAVGFAHNICAWIKGIYSTVMERGIRTVIAVSGGDCSNTVALAELFGRRGIRVIPFHYPFDRDAARLRDQIEHLRVALSASWEDIEGSRSRLERIRSRLRELDTLTFRENRISGYENHLFLVNSSDFNGDPDLYEEELDRFIQEARQRKPREEGIRLGYLGVPSAFSGLYETIESLGARVVFNETQRQFSMPYKTRDIVEQYLRYTYPYEIEGRIRDVLAAIEERSLDGLIHYTQTFCYRQIYDIMLREALDLPILTLEGDRPGPVDGRTAFRIEAFIEMLRERKSG